MSTNLVAFLLVHRWRNGVTLPRLVESFRHLTADLFSRKIDVGFSGIVIELNVLTGLGYNQ